MVFRAIQRLRSQVGADVRYLLCDRSPRLRTVGIVFQESFLFNTSVRENIRPGKQT